MNDFKELENWQTRYGFASPDHKLNIYYSKTAFAKTIQLIKYHPVEVGWNMTVVPYKDGYKVLDIYVYPQKVSAAYVSVDVPNYGMWKAYLDEEVDANLFGHGHSHVHMGTFASIVDESQQHDEVLTKKNGFYLFQIWNKRNEINSFFYDIDNRIYYTKDDINMIVEEVDEFVLNSYGMVTGERDIKQFEAGEDFESEQVV